jgi:hypothetical protein
VELETKILINIDRYTKTELAKRVAIFHMTSPLGTAFGGYLVRLAMVGNIGCYLADHRARTSKRQYTNHLMDTSVSQAGDGYILSVVA